MFRVTARPPRTAFTLIELLVAIGIIGLLMAVLLPAVQAGREAARRSDCSNRVRQLALAAHMHHDTHGFFPPARYESRPDDDIADKCGAETPTWLARVMPYIDQGSLGEQWDLSKQWHLHEEHVRTTVPSVFLCPSRRAGTRPIGTRTLARVIVEEPTAPGEGRITYLPCGCPVFRPPDPEPGGPPTTVSIEATGALCDYAGNHGDLTPGSTGASTDFYYGGNGSGVIISARPRCEAGVAVAPRDRITMTSVTDGSSNTLLFGEKFVPPDQLGEFPVDSPAYDGDHLPASARLAGPGLRLAKTPDDIMADQFSFGSWHSGVVTFAMVDGSVRFLSTDTDTKLLGSLANRLDARLVELVQ